MTLTKSFNSFFSERFKAHLVRYVLEIVRFARNSAYESCLKGGALFNDLAYFILEHVVQNVGRCMKDERHENL